MNPPVNYPVRWLEHRIREYFYEPLGRKKIADQFRYLAKFAGSETTREYLNRRAEKIAA